MESTLPETVLTLGSASILLSALGAVWGLAAITSLASGGNAHSAEAMQSHERGKV